MSIEKAKTGTLRSLASGNEALKKVVIEHETTQANFYNGTIEALFNPSQLRYSRDVSWAIEPVSGQLAGAHWVAFQASRPQTLTVDLFFDTYEGDPNALGQSAIVRGVRALLPDNPITRRNERPSGADVTGYANKVINLAMVQPELHRPPRCRVWWGRYVLIRGVLTSVTEDYSFFLADGTPVRTTLTCAFTEALDRPIELHSADVAKQRVLRRGETLARIALEEYNDASQWRLIADANRGKIPNPRVLAAGIVLEIPPLPAADG